MSLLTIVQDAMAICGITSASSAYGTSDPTAAQFVALAQVEGDELSRFADWRSLKVSAQLTGDGTSTLWDLPEDFDRFMPGQMLWSDQGAGEFGGAAGFFEKVYALGLLSAGASIAYVIGAGGAGGVSDFNGGDDANGALVIEWDYP